MLFRRFGQFATFNNQMEGITKYVEKAGYRLSKYNLLVLD